MGINIKLPSKEIIEFKEALIFAFLGVLYLNNEVKRYYRYVGTELSDPDRGQSLAGPNMPTQAGNCGDANTAVNINIHEISKYCYNDSMHNPDITMRLGDTLELRHDGQDVPPFVIVNNAWEAEWEWPHSISCGVSFEHLGG